MFALSRRLFAKAGQEPDSIEDADICNFLGHLAVDRNVSVSTQNRRSTPFFFSSDMFLAGEIGIMSPDMILQLKFLLDL